MSVRGYELKQEFGADPMYRVFRARSPEGVRVLLKQVRQEGQRSAAVERLRKEFQIGRSLSLEGLVRPRELLEESGGEVLVSEDPGGEPLEWVLSRGALPLSTALKLVADLALTLAGLHRAGYIHRDVRPFHLLFDEGCGRVSLMGLANSTVIPRAVQGFRGFQLNPAAAAYLSPELTGRTSRLVDYRTDLYSLGVIFFELLLGKRPFESPDPFELIHAHVAKLPPCPSDIAPAIPRTVSEIVLKLLSKAAEDRYQGGEGLHHDLTRCIEELDSAGRLPGFALARHDPPPRLELSQRFYGRQRELEVLRRAVEDARQGNIRMMLVTGYPGVGKTSLVHEFRRAVFERQGWVGSGKYDALGRGAPYSGIIEALRDLWRRLLAEESRRLSECRQRLIEALGPHLGVITAATPELERIVGTPPPVPALGAVESKNRFHRCFQQALQALTAEDAPLVLFLDDLQWADASSLELIEGALEKGLRNCLFVGAYRDNEVDESHPLTRTFQRIQDKGISLETIGLRPLDVQDIRSLVADTLRTVGNEATPLADLVFRKTAGNAFFARAFLTTLYDEGLLDWSQGAGWTWDLRRIAQAQGTENLLELASRKVANLPDPVRHTISLAAALGHRLELGTLVAVCEASAETVEADLIVACRERVLLKGEHGYQFEHDRLQETAYAAIPEASRAETHLRIGRLLTAGTDSSLRAARVFEVLEHLNRAQDLLNDPAERLDTVRLNVAAGRMARAAAAFPAAHGYFSHALALLPADPWKSHYELALDLYSEAAEAAFLTSNFREADRLVNVVLAHASDILGKVAAYETQIAVAHARGREEEALRITREVVAQLGVPIPPEPSDREVNQAVLEARRRVQDILSEPPDRVRLMSDERSLAAMRLLTRAGVAAGMVNYPLYWLIVCAMVELTARFGHSPEAPVTYIMAGGMLSYLVQDYEGGYRAGERGMALLESLGSPRWQSFCHFLFTIDIKCWRAHCDALVEGFSEAHRMGLETGDLLSASTSAHLCCESALHSGMELGRLERFIRAYREESGRLGIERVASGLLELEKLAQTLREGFDASAPPETSLFASEGWKSWQIGGDHTLQELSVCHEMMTLLLYRAGARATERALRAASLPPGCISGLLPADFYVCLCLLEGLDSVVGRERERYFAIIAARQEQMRVKARACPSNLQHRLDLVEAERLRVLGDHLKAMEFFDRAIEGARRSRYVHEEALANELAAEFYFELGRERIGSMYVQAAAFAYGRWGAWGKLDQLHAQYPGAFSKTLERPFQTDSRLGDSTVEGTGEVLDMASVERAAAALSCELDLPKLLQMLMRILLQSAGAQRGFLLQEEDGKIVIEASGSVDEETITVLQGEPLEESAELSRSIVRYVSRSRDVVVIEDATADERFAATSYVARTRPKSILCMPIVHRGRPVAFLYLENNRIDNAFSGDRAAAIQIISSQAAVALENARLYVNLKEEVGIRRKAEEDLREAMEEVRRLKDKLHAENTYLREEIQGIHGFEQIIGKSQMLTKVLHRVTQVAPTDATVLILGETGTGKEPIARAIHNRSSRKESALVRVNCATLPATLIESELFGHEKGAFTGAHTRKVGRFELADGGTVFLDEIGELPLELQAKLLRVIQEGEFERVGSSLTQKVNVRVIAATNRNLRAEAEAGAFRSDLYYRLSVFPIELPPLRERGEDIPLLVWHFVARKQAELGKAISTIPTSTMEALLRYAWPGNIRELENVIERAIILSPGPHLTLDESFAVSPSPETELPTRGSLEDIERAHIRTVLEQCDWKVKGRGNAADRLGLNPSTLRFRMKKLGLERVSV
ncbi:MAG: sigma 54-interacting transcriptional regulator [Deltaproteobacteria bacterium]|nr:sigma 54-interacting transcriptional regulator [Deltaproteobacteria bacterium]